MSNKTIGNVCQLLNGYSFKSNQYVEDGIRVIRIANVQKGYIEDNTPAFYPLSSKGLDNYMLEEGDLLISLTGNVGRVALLGSEMLPAALNQRVACLRLKDNSIDKKFLFHYLNSSNFENKCVQESKGVAQKNMSTEWLKRQEIPSFTYKEQKEISSILDRISNIIKSKTRQLTEYDQLIKSRFVEMFGDPLDNPFNWKLMPLNCLGSLSRGKSKHRPRNAPELLGGDYPLIQTGDIANSDLYITEYNSTYSELGLKQSKMWDEETLCITIAANIAKTAILKFKACFPDSVVGFIPNEQTNNIFIHYWFSFFQKILEKQAPESAQKNINLKILEELKVILPSINLQNDFTQFVHKVDKLKFTVQKSLEETQTLFDSLMQKYFG